MRPLSRKNNRSTDWQLISAPNFSFLSSIVVVDSFPVLLPFLVAAFGFPLWQRSRYTPNQKPITLQFRKGNRARKEEGQAFISTIIKDSRFSYLRLQEIQVSHDY
jgi:hypothetical protein